MANAVTLDPTVSTSPRSEERYAAELVGRVLGATITDRDDGSEAGMVDALFEMPDGRLGALEVTIVADRRAMQAEALGDRLDGLRVPGARGVWTLVADRRVIMRNADRHIASLVLSCEERGLGDPTLLLVEEFVDDPAYRWWVKSHRPSLRGSFETNRPGTVNVMPDLGPAVWVQDLAGLTDWLHSRFESEPVAGKLRKLSATGRPEQHLFLILHESSDIPPHVLERLNWSDTVPSEPLEPPEGLTGLWLAGRWRNPILRWHKAAGWSRQPLE
jgi:hypothetical protein